MPIHGRHKPKTQFPGCNYSTPWSFNIKRHLHTHEEKDTRYKQAVLEVSIKMTSIKASKIFSVYFQDITKGFGADELDRVLEQVKSSLK